MFGTERDWMIATIVFAVLSAFLGVAVWELLCWIASHVTISWR